MSKNSYFQIGGQKHAILLLDKFLDNNGNYYNKNISKPYLSVDSCSRLSPYLSWGNLSIKYVINRLKKNGMKQVKILILVVFIIGLDGEIILFKSLNHNHQ